MNARTRLAGWYHRKALAAEQRKLDWYRQRFTHVVLVDAYEVFPTPYGTGVAYTPRGEQR